MTIPLGVVEVDSSGAFEIMVPSFTGKAGDGAAQLEFYLDLGKVVEKPAALRVVGKSGTEDWLKVSADYPDVVELVAEIQ